MTLVRHFHEPMLELRRGVRALPILFRLYGYSPIDRGAGRSYSRAVQPDQFIAELDRNVAQALAALGRQSAEGPAPEPVAITKLLTVALKNELEATEEAAIWLVSERDVEVKLALARQCGDEAKHYRLIEERLRALGADMSRVDPLAQGYSPMFEFLRGLATTTERLAAGQFTREALAQVRNAVFVDWCDAHGDHETARLYREIIQPDEAYHHQLGRRLLPRFVVTAEQQDMARRASARVLVIADELQEAARLKAGLCRLPGC